MVLENKTNAIKMRISEKKREKIFEQIISLLYSRYPSPLFTSHIALEIARDEEFVGKLMFDLKGKGIAVEIRKNSKGVEYVRRKRWTLSDKAHQKYSQMSS